MMSDRQTILSVTVPGRASPRTCRSYGVARRAHRFSSMRRTGLIIALPPKSSAPAAKTFAPGRRLVVGHLRGDAGPKRSGIRRARWCPAEWRASSGRSRFRSRELAESRRPRGRYLPRARRRRRRRTRNGPDPAVVVRAVLDAENRRLRPAEPRQSPPPKRRPSSRPQKKLFAERKARLPPRSR